MERLQLEIPQSRVAATLKNALDVAHAVTRPVFLDAEHVPTQGPFVLVGNHQLLGMQDPALAAPLRAVARRVGRTDVGTVLVKGSTFGVLPGAGRLYFRFGAPIATTPWAGRSDDPDALSECRDIVKAEVEAHVAHLRALRDGDPQRALLPRVGQTVRSALPL